MSACRGDFLDTGRRRAAGVNRLGNPSDPRGHDRGGKGTELELSFGKFTAIPTRLDNGKKLKNVNENHLSIILSFCSYFIIKSKNFTKAWRIRTG